MSILEVYIEHKTIKLNTRFSYLHMHPVLKGTRVKVNFHNQICIAMVVSCTEYTSDIEKSYLDQKITLKPILEIIDPLPILNDELLQLGEQVALDTLSSVMSCYQTMLPKMLKPNSTAKIARVERMVHFESEPIKTTDRQKAILDELRSVDKPYTALKKEFGTPLDTLIKNGCLSTYDREMNYSPKPYEKISVPYELSDAQNNAYEAIKTSPQSVLCLYGPTGSGKTELYLKLAEDAMLSGKQALILVPEIALTPLMIKRVQDRFGQDVIVYHSHLNDHERYLQYLRVLSKESLVVVGTRSAVWLPFDRLDIIVLDEEHDHSYKQESAPRYHSRDIAIHRAKHFGCKVILGSATPSFETYARALKGVYGLIQLPKRISGILPTVTVVPPDYRFNPIFSSQAVVAIQHRLDHHQQIIILLNRRGYAPVYQCLQCFSSVSCPHCDRLLSVHKENHLLKCHSCDYQTPLIHVCPVCGHDELRMIGIGTQRVEGELQRLFPSAKVLRMDSDSTSRKNAHEQILDTFQNHQADILCGTQMIAKGLDIPNVTLSLILDIDKSLLRTDYRSVEDAFDLMVQAAGRSGRGDLQGEVIFQSALKDHYAIKLAIKHDYPAFFHKEMSYRQLGQNPPYTYLIYITLTHKEEIVAQSEAFAMYEAFKQMEIDVLGPSDLGKLKDIYRYRLIVKGKDLSHLRDKVSSVINQKSTKSDVVADVNPMAVL
ncbi:MAG: primosomal protein N' (replication factor Y) (superfamily II helicase) [Erysipelotrichaceae bacterium]|nr:MAG: primosomal protein N' (replication factor Y) [Erysipelotrichaceae bacterium]TXT16891.1 MAG: primosomal protein N' (replication factor Y) (superfamily II helicase) [Erysipelotrichaceae bacterium]